MITTQKSCLMDKIKFTILNSPINDMINKIYSFLLLSFVSISICGSKRLYSLWGLPAEDFSFLVFNFVSIFTAFSFLLFLLPSHLALVLVVHIPCRHSTAANHSDTPKNSWRWKDIVLWFLLGGSVDTCGWDYFFFTSFHFVIFFFSSFAFSSFFASRAACTECR